MWTTSLSASFRISGYLLSRRFPSRLFPPPCVSSLPSGLHSSPRLSSLILSVSLSLSCSPRFLFFFPFFYFFLFFYLERHPHLTSPAINSSLLPLLIIRVMSAPAFRDPYNLLPAPRGPGGHYPPHRSLLHRWTIAAGEDAGEIEGKEEWRDSQADEGGEVEGEMRWVTN